MAFFKVWNQLTFLHDMKLTSIKQVRRKWILGIRIHK